MGRMQCWKLYHISLAVKSLTLCDHTKDKPSSIQQKHEQVSCRVFAHMSVSHTFFSNFLNWTVRLNGVNMKWVVDVPLKWIGCVFCLGTSVSVQYSVGYTHCCRSGCRLHCTAGSPMETGFCSSQIRSVWAYSSNSLILFA